MSKHEPSLSAIPPSKLVQRHDGWTLAKQAGFLRQLSATHSVTEAAKSVSMSRQSAYRLRSRLKGQAFDLAWEVAFHHSYDVLAHAALDRALNGVEVPVYFQGEQVGSYRKYDERLTVALLGKQTLGGNPAIGRLGPSAERHARDFEALLGKLETGEAVDTGARRPEEPGEIETIRQPTSASIACGPSVIAAGSAKQQGGTKPATESPSTPSSTPPNPCPSTLSDEELIQAIHEGRAEMEK